jgi:pantothenate kinase type III
MQVPRTYRTPENWRELATEGVGLHLGLNTIEALLAGAIGGANAELQERVEAFHNEFGTFRVALTGGRRRNAWNSALRAPFLPTQTSLGKDFT